MRRVCGLICLFIFLTAAGARDASAQRGGSKKVVVVLPFTSPTKYNFMGRNSQATFITQLVKTRKLRVIQGGMVRKMMRRYHLRWAGTLDPKLLKAAGSYLKADYVLAGKLRWGGDAYMLSVHVMDVRTLETTMAEDVDFRDTRKMRVAVRIAAKKIAGSISGTGSGSSKAGLFLNVNPRAFYATSDFCIRAMTYVVKQHYFRGTVQNVQEEKKTVRVKGYGRNLPRGTPLDIYSHAAIDGPKKLVTVYVTANKGGGIYDTVYRMGPEDGIQLGAKVYNHKHRYVVAVGKIVDEAEDNDKLVKRFRHALLEKMSEGTQFQQIEGVRTDFLAKTSHRRRRFITYKKLFNQGVEVVLEGKFYGSNGSRRAHFKIYSTYTGKLLGEPKFETSL